MTVRMADLRLSSWVQIVKTIEGGKNPEQRWLLEALRRHEPVIPVVAQNYIADLIEGKVVHKLGRRALTQDQIDWKAIWLVHRVNRWSRVFEVRRKANNPRHLAYEKIEEEKGWAPGTAKRKHSTATKRIKSIRLRGLWGDLRWI